MSTGLLLKHSTSLIPLAAQAVDASLASHTHRLQKTTDVIGAHIFNIAPKINAKVAASKSSGWTKALVLLSVLFIHVAAFSWLATIEPPQTDTQKSAAPMMVSVIAPPAPEVVPEPEIVPVVAPVKVVKKVKPKPKKIVKKIVPVAEATQPMVEATTDPVIEEPLLEEALVAAPAPAAAVEVAPTPVIVEEKVEPPKFGVSYLNNPAPTYPRFSRRAGEEGRVLLKVLVTAGGNAETVSIAKSSGFKRLDKAAIRAVERWRFVPARKGGEALSAYVLVPVKFSLGS